MHRDNSGFEGMQHVSLPRQPLVFGLREWTEGGWRRMKMGHNLMLFAMIVGLLSVGSQDTLAQQTASINGTVVDPSSAAIPSAELVLTNVETGVTRRALSSAQGYFNFTDLSAARYSLRVTAQGFETLNMSGLTLNVQQQMTVAPVLRLGTSTQTVAVTGTPPPVTTSSASIDQTVQSSQLVNLPLNGRNPVQLLGLTPGVINQAGGGNFGQATGGQFGMVQLQFSAPGTRTNDFNYSLDGGTNNDTFYDLADSFPNPDALQEFTVETRGVNATQGRGSTEVWAQTKSGTNQFHGSAFEFVRNYDMDSRPFFASTVPIFKRNQFGGTVGGPIIKNKLFFFASYQGTRQVGTPGVTEYPTLTAAERAGNFSALSKALTNPLGGTFSNNIIPPAQITTFATNYIQKQLPAANDPTGSFFIFSPAATLDQNQLVSHTDYEVGSHDRISFLYFLDNIPQIAGRTTATSPAQASILPTRHQNWTLRYTHIFTPNLLNEFHVTYNRDAFGVSDPVSNDFPYFDQLGLGIDTGDAIPGLGQQSHMSVSGFWSDTDAAPTRDRIPNTEIGDMMSWVHGAHTLRFGVQIYKNRANELQNYLTDGALTYDGFESGNAGADFLLGYASQFEQEEPTISRIRQILPSFYFQDDFRATRRLTLNLGLRWDPTSGYNSEDKSMSTFITGVQSTLFPLAFPGMLYPGDHGLPSNIVGSRLDDLAPRVGVAWDVFGNGKTALRASFATYFIPNTDAINMNRFANVPPFDFNINVYNTSLNSIWSGSPFNGVDPFPFPAPGNIAQLATIPFPATVATTILGLPWKTPANQEWSFSIQQAIGVNAGLEVAYIGSSAADQFTSLDGNPAVYSSTATTGNIQSRRLYPLIGPIENDSNALSSNYNALEVTFRKKYSQHVMFLSTYTWSQALGITAPTGEGGLGTRDPFDQALDYGRLNFNYAQNWVTSFIWNLPFGERSSSRFVQKAVAGWQVNAINTVYSGEPLSVLSGKDPLLNGDNLETANLVGSFALPGGRSKAAQIAEWFNTAAFAQPATGTFGTAGQSILTGPGLWNTDFGIYKTFKVREGVNLQIRGQFYNVFNHAALGNPNTTLSNGSFGKITSTGTPRVVELGAHIEF